MDNLSGKLVLSKGKTQGGLKDCLNTYSINYLPSSQEYPVDKISIEVNIESLKNDKIKPKPRSLRFNETGQLKTFILELIQAYTYYLIRRNKINSNNYNYIIHDLNKNINQIIIKTLKNAKKTQK